MDDVLGRPCGGPRPRRAGRGRRRRRPPPAAGPGVGEAQRVPRDRGRLDEAARRGRRGRRAAATRRSGRGSELLGHAAVDARHRAPAAGGSGTGCRRRAGTARTPCSRRAPRPRPRSRPRGCRRARGRGSGDCRSRCTSGPSAQTLVDRMSSSSPAPGGSSRSTTATPPSTERTAFMTPMPRPCTALRSGVHRPVGAVRSMHIRRGSAEQGQDVDLLGVDDEVVRFAVPRAGPVGRVGDPGEDRVGRLLPPGSTAGSGRTWARRSPPRRPPVTVSRVISVAPASRITATRA